MNNLSGVKLHQPYLLAAWPGMGNVATGALNYLKDKLRAKELMALDVKEFFDPVTVVIAEETVQPCRLPLHQFFYWQTRPSAHDLILFLAEAQPTNRGYALAHRVLEVALQFGVGRVFTCAAAPTAVHHQAPARVWAVGNSPSLTNYLRGFSVKIMEQGQISGMNGLLLAVARERGVEALCLLGEIPYYTVGIPNPRASKAVLDVLATMLGLSLDTEELELMAREIEKEVQKLIQSSEQVARFAEYLRERQVVPATESDEKGPSLAELTRHRQHIEKLFAEVEADLSRAGELKATLDRYGLFSEYEDRFLNLFRRGHH